MDTLQNQLPNHITPTTVTPEMVRGLSLHDITQRYGTLGLYTRLESSLQEANLAEHPQVAWAVQFGLMLHGDDPRSNGHYADHLLRVTLRMIDGYGITDPDIVAACPLHDSVEDHPQEIVQILSGEWVEDIAAARERAFGLLGNFVSEETVHIVRVVTNPLLQPGEDKNEVYYDHTKELVRNEPKGRVLKLDDFTDNGVGNHYTAVEKRGRLDVKYVGLYTIHRSGLFMPDSLITGKKRIEIASQLTKGHLRALGRIAANSGK